jgi:DNA-binding FadR family transcriptional regulator
VITPQPGAAVYEQLANLLREEILTGRLRPGERLPSETRLQQEYGLARQTVRRAVGVLRAEGLVVVSRGHGVLVREHAEMQDLVPAPGSTVSARMPTVDERAELDIPDGVPVFWVISPDGISVVYPADRWRLRWPSS